MRKILILISFATFLFSCVQQSTKENVKEEILVIHSTFYKATYAMSKNDWHDAMRFGPMFPPSGAPKFKVTSDTALKAVKHLYIIKDSLNSITVFNFRPKKASNELEKLLLTTKHKSTFAVLSKKHSAYEIFSIRDTSIIKKGDFNGELSFSRVVFNTQKTKACYYFDQYLKSSKWGMGAVVYAEKIKGKWVFVRYEEIWVA
jgi:hypothetical protein